MSQCAPPCACTASTVSRVRPFHPGPARVRPTSIFSPRESARVCEAPRDVRGPSRREPTHSHVCVVFPISYFWGLVEFVPIARFSAKEHRARVDGRATARHLHGIIERTVRCYTAKVSAESAGAVASTMFLESLPTRQSGRLAQPDGGAGTPAGRGCHLQGRSAPPSWTTP